MIRRTLIPLAVILIAALLSTHGRPLLAGQASAPGVSFRVPVGSTSTRLADGHILVVGGEGPQGALAAAWLVDPDSTTVIALPAQMIEGRTGHSATVLPDGTVLIVGGRGSSGELVRTIERFEPATEVFGSVSLPDPTPRSGHTATLLTDGRVLLVGGVTDANAPAAEIWNLDAQTVHRVEASAGWSSGHTATLLADGRVLIASDTRVSTGGTGNVRIDVFDPRTDSIAPLNGAPSDDGGALLLAQVLPVDGAVDVALDATIVLRLSHPAVPNTITEQTISVSGPTGVLPSQVVSAEGGRLMFLRPLDALLPDTTYEVRLDGVADDVGARVEPGRWHFKTKTATAPPAESDVESWIPEQSPVPGRWRTDRPPSPWQTLPPLRAELGVTALAGQVLTLDGRPLPDVTLRIDGDRVQSDRTGRFLLRLMTAGPGHHQLFIDGQTVSRPARAYGLFEYGLQIEAGQTTVLPFTIWMPRLDVAHQVTIASPTSAETVITTPFIPGLELHLPAGAVVRDESGKVVTHLGITPIPIDRTPFPLPAHVSVPIYFTIQPGSAYVSVTGPGSKRARLVYPNYHHAAPSVVAAFWQYDPDQLGWHTYGAGQVTADGKQVVPYPGVGIYEFTGAMMDEDQSPPADVFKQGPEPADPVSAATGLFVLRKTDVFLPDVIPLALTRTYRSNDPAVRPFGIGASHPYAMFLWSANQYQEADLVPPDGSRIHYVRTSPGTGFTDAVFAHTTTPTAYYNSTIKWNPTLTGWDLTLTNGTVFHFGEDAPLQFVQDRFGNRVTLTWSEGVRGNITQVTSPNGRWISFAYDASNRITQATDNAGRAVSYTYDASGRLWKVTDPIGGVTEYTYDSSHRMLTVKDARGIVYLTNQYDANSRVNLQTLANTGTFVFSYTLDGSNNVTRTDVTNPRGVVTRWNFNADGYVTSQTEAVGDTEERTTTFARQAGSNFIASVTDALNRQTSYTYTTNGFVASITRLAGTEDAVTTGYTYEPLFNQPATVTDPLGHTWTRSYDAQGRLTGIADPLTHQTTVVMNAAGQLTSVSDPLQHGSQFGYLGGDLVSITNPLGVVTRRVVDAAGRAIVVADATGATTQTVFDNFDRPTSVTDSLGGQTSFSYDANNNLLSLTDAENHPTTYTYNSSDRVDTRTDPLTHASSFQYDLNGNLAQSTDRESQVTAFQYDALDRLTQVTFNDSSTIAYTYDAGDRLTQVADSANGTIARTYDDLDRLLQETTSQGTVSYTYDTDGRRASMTVAGQPTVSYSYDAAHHLASMTQGGSFVAMTYDAADRRSTLTLPNGIVGTYGYDAANELTSLVYTLNSNVVGDLAYTYDAAGRRTSVSGSLARTSLPPVLASATYDAANRIATWNGTAFSYDANGNLTSDGLTAYTWNARGQLSTLNGNAAASFQYDGTGRRRGKTIGGTSTGFLYDGANFVQELTAGGVPTANLLTGLNIDETFARTDDGGARSLLTDALGSTIELADAAGTLQTHYTSEPFGVSSTSGAMSTNAAQFTSRENDNAGVYFARQRFYAPRLQRFISEDPIEFRGGDVNLHVYARNAPTTWTDPTGLFVAAPWSGGAACNARKNRYAYLLQCNPLLAAGFAPLLGWAESATAAAAAAMGAGTGTGAGAGKAAAGASESAAGPRAFYGTPQGPLIEAPPGYEPVTARNGQGLVLQPEGQTLGDNSNVIRWGEPNAQNPNGYFRYYNDQGQPLNPATGQPGPDSITHIPPDYQGPLNGYPGK